MNGFELKRLAVAFAVGAVALAACAPATPPAAAPAAKPAAPAKEAAAPAKEAAAPAPAPAAKPAAPAAAAKALTKVNFSQPSTAMAYGPIMLAEAKGFLKEEGLDWETTLTGSGAKSMAALIGGSVHLNTQEYSDVILASEKGQTTLGFAAMTSEMNLGIVMKRAVAAQRGVSDKSPLADRIKALKGLKIGITSPGSGTDSLVRYLMQSQKLDPDRDADIVASGSGPNILAAFGQGQIDAFAQVSPVIEQAVVRHDGVLLISTPRGDVAELRGRIGFAIVGRKDWLDKNVEIATKVTKAVWRAEQLIKAKPQEAKDALKKAVYPELEPAIWDLVWDNSTPQYPKDPTMTPEGVKRTIDFMSAVSKQPIKATFDQVATNKFVELARKEIKE